VLFLVLKGLRCQPILNRFLATPEAATRVLTSKSFQM
jgi:hypothetical protein